MNDALVPYLLESVHKVFEKAFDIGVCEIASPPREDLIYSKVAIIDDVQTREIIIGMPKEGLIFLSKTCFGSENDPSDEEIQDLIKELANLIIGRVKVTFSAKNKKIRLGISKIVSLKNLDNSIIKYFKVKDTYLMLIY